MVPVEDMLKEMSAAGDELTAEQRLEKLLDAFAIVVKEEVSLRSAAKSPTDGKTPLMSSTASLTQKNVDQFAPITRPRRHAETNRGEAQRRRESCPRRSRNRTRMQAVGADPSGNTPEEFPRFIRDDQAKWAKLKREVGIQPE